MHPERDLEVKGADDSTSASVPPSVLAAPPPEPRSGRFGRRAVALVVAAGLSVGGAALLVSALNAGRPLAFRVEPAVVRLVPPTDEQLAAQALEDTRDEAIARAVVRVERRLPLCSLRFFSWGEGQVVLTIAPTGYPSRVEVARGPLSGTDAGQCVERAFQDVVVPPFEGGAVTVRRSFHLP